MKKTISIALILASAVLLGILIYALNFAEPGSGWQKNRILIGMSFMATTRFAITFLRRPKKAAL